MPPYHKIRFNVGDPNVYTRPLVQNLPIPDNCGNGYFAGLFFSAESLFVERESTVSPVSEDRGLVSREPGSELSGSRLLGRHITYASLHRHIPYASTQRRDATQRQVLLREAERLQSGQLIKIYPAAAGSDTIPVCSSQPNLYR